MSDPDPADQVIKAAQHLGSGGLGGVLVGLWHKFRSDRREEKLESILNAQNVQLAVMAKTLTDLAADISKHEGVFSDVVETKLMVKALHARVDTLEGKKRR